ncbi:F-box domain-containing protein [Mycena sanguinolenta]|uniref:F-box domain-containing protein n=1 Tax=Mycena sanguinolenta TaxID=230812 RepID=A0A8H6XXK3_9AGAR|nr:F-box domain-containing protein [Mycena sanguinolenta]
MSSALQARIDELSLAIERQKQVLLDLEKSRSHARCELNAILDPMARLPVEISSDIFVWCLPDSPRPHSGQAPLLFLRICHRWSDIAIATPTLWTSISCPSLADGADLDIWLQRAGDLPLSISLHGSLHSSAAVAVEQYAHRLRDMMLQPRHLEQLAIQFPSLATLRVLGLPDDRTGGRECLDIMRKAPALTKCDLNPIRWFRNAPPTPLTHHSLRRLRLRGLNCSSSVLKYLTLPALERLHISDLNLTTGELAAFFVRSSPPLLSLRVEGLDDEDLRESLRLVPNVTDLSMKFPEPTIDPLMVLLEDLGPNRELLPNLRNLCIEDCFNHDVDYEAVIDALVARRVAPQSRLQSFKLITQNPEPHPDSIAALRKFAEESGMQIHVGTSRYNYI